LKENKIFLEISGMTCDHCAVSIEKLLEKKKGILSKKVSYAKSKSEVSFDTEVISKEEIINAVNQGNHYKAKETIHINSRHFDLIIIGGGSAAFSAAIKANELGLTTLLVNGGLDFGGTCVNVGCVPSKTLLRAGETAYHATHSNFAGIKPRGVDIDFAQVIKGKKQLVKTLQQKKYMDVVSDFKNLQMIKGWAEFMDDKTILVNGKDEYTAIKFIIATGATTNIPDIEGLKDIGYLTNVTLFDLEEKPTSITIMGAGFIGLEIAMAYNRLEKSGDDTLIYCKCPDGIFTKLTEPGKVVVASGTKPNTQKLGLHNIGLQVTQSGHIQVNEMMETNLNNIYAVGDVTNAPAFVYTAAFEGKIAVENAFTGSEIKADYLSLPWVVFTDPQVAGAGLDEAQASAQNIPFEVSKILLSDVPRSIAANDIRGFIKLIRNPETDKLLGARIVAPEGGELIQQLSMAIKYGITVKELAESFYPYLTLAEGIKLAAITFGKDVSKLSCCAS